jgi:hypothetical protein
MKLCSYFPLPGFSRKYDIAAFFVLFVLGCGFEVYVTFLFYEFSFTICSMCCVVFVFCFKMHMESDFDEMAAWLEEKVSSTFRL